MKKLIIAVVALVTLASCNQQKTGYVDVAKVMEEYDAVKDMEKEVKAKSDAFQAKYEQIAAEMDAQIKAKKMSQTDAQNQGQQLQMAYQQEGQALQQETEAMQKKLIDDFKEFVKEYAKKNGYAFVLGSNESGNVLYGSEKADLTEKIIDAINEDYGSGDKTEKSAKEEPKKEDAVKVEPVKVEPKK